MQNRMLRRVGLIALMSLVLAVSLVSVSPTIAQSPCGATVRVTFGDTLFAIAARCGVTYQALRAANPQIVDPNRLLVGQVLNIPTGETPPDVSQYVVALYPQRGAAGTPVTVIVNGFPANAHVNVFFGRVGATVNPQAPLITDTDGALITQVATPPNTPVGELWYITVQVLDTGAQATSLPFSVIAPTTPVTLPPPLTLPPPPATATTPPRLFDRANMYLIALEDGGISGPAVGCGDSVIPVQTTFAPTVAPLTAALQNLLALDGPYFGESGLYNALHQSSLSLQGVTIVGGLATINLTGQLMVGGVCDSPRIIAQLQQTAFQFGTVQRVAINVNGTPLEQLLSQQ